MNMGWDGMACRFGGVLHESAGQWSGRWYTNVWSLAAVQSARDGFDIAPTVAASQLQCNATRSFAMAQLGLGPGFLVAALGRAKFKAKCLAQAQSQMLRVKGQGLAQSSRSS